jgi:hypothetical protein
MLLTLLYLQEPTPGQTRYIVSRDARLKMYLPDLLRRRFYIMDNSKFFTSSESYLPKVSDKLEYDARADEWFIVSSV